MSNIFTSINYRIKTANKRNDEIHLGFYKAEDMSDSDRAELQTWESVGSTLYTKEINGVLFKIEIESKGVRGE